MASRIARFAAAALVNIGRRRLRLNLECPEVLVSRR